MRSRTYDDALAFVDELFPHQALRNPVRELVRKGYGICEKSPSSARLVREGFFGERAVSVQLDERGQVTLRRC